MSFQKCSKSVNIGLWYVSIMSWIQRNGVCFNVVCTRLIGKIFWVVKTSWFRWSFTRPITEIWILILIQPNSRKLNLWVEYFKHILPIFCCIGMKIVNESCWTWPNFPNQLFLSCSIFDKNSSIFSFLISNTVYFYTCINNWNIMILICDLFHFVQRKSSLINCKILMINHIIYVWPYPIKRKRIFLVRIQYIL